MEKDKVLEPLQLLKYWIDEEKTFGNPFPQGAVLSTVAENGAPHSRMVGTMLDEAGRPKFHTSPASRKVIDIRKNKRASLTYSFQGSLRSISLEGSLVMLEEAELKEDWLKYDAKFRRDYYVFGEISGLISNDLSEFYKKREILRSGIEENMPTHFIGYKFYSIERVSFYSVLSGGFAKSLLYKYEDARKAWVFSRLVP